MADPSPKIPGGAPSAEVSPPAPDSTFSAQPADAQTADQTAASSVFTHSEDVCGRELTNPPLYDIPAWIRYYACSLRELDCFEPQDNSTFLELIRYAKAMGVPLQLKDAPLGVLAVRRFEGAEEDGNWHNFLWEKASEFFYNRSFDYSDGGLQLPLSWGWDLKVLPFDRVSERDSGPITVPAVITYVDIGRENGRIVVLDTITNEILFEESFKLDDESPEDMLKKAARFVDHKRIRRELDALAALPPEDCRRLEAHAVFEFQSDAAPETISRIQAEWEAAPSLLGNVNFEVTVPYFEENLHGLASETYLRVAPEEMRKNGYRPIIIRPGGRRFMAGIYRSDYSSGFATSTPPYFADSPEDPKYRPIAIDLSWIGGGKIEHTFLQEAFRPVDTVGAYRVYADDSVRHSRYRDEIESLTGGVSTAERDFGEKPGGVVKRLYIPDVLPVEMAAHVDGEECETIVFHDETFRCSDVIAWLAGQHEAFHCIDFKHGLSDDPEFKGWFESRVKNGDGDFLKAVSEKRLHGLSFGGASWKNEKEFFACLLNSLYSPRRKRELRGMPPRFRTFYIESLERARAVIARKISPDLPIIGKIDRVIAETRALQ